MGSPAKRRHQRLARRRSQLQRERVRENAIEAKRNCWDTHILPKDWGVPPTKEVKPFGGYLEAAARDHSQGGEG